MTKRISKSTDGLTMFYGRHIFRLEEYVISPVNLAIKDMAYVCELHKGIKLYFTISMMTGDYSYFTEVNRPGRAQFRTAKRVFRFDTYSRQTCLNAGIREAAKLNRIYA